MAQVIIAEPFNEQTLQTKVTGGFTGSRDRSRTWNNLVVVSGYGGPPRFGDSPRGSPNSDSDDVLYLIQIVVGPEWREIDDVSPIAIPAGYYHFSSDTADATGWDTTNCSWDPVPGTIGQRIQLTVQFIARGGPDFRLRTLAYHLTAIGNLASE